MDENKTKGNELTEEQDEGGEMERVRRRADNGRKGELSSYGFFIRHIVYGY